MKDSDRNNAKNETPDIFIAVKHELLLIPNT